MRGEKRSTTAQLKRDENLHLLHQLPVPIFTPRHRRKCPYIFFFKLTLFLWPIREANNAAWSESHGNIRAKWHSVCRVPVVPFRSSFDGLVLLINKQGVNNKSRCQEPWDCLFLRGWEGGRCVDTVTRQDLSLLCCIFKRAVPVYLPARSTGFFWSFQLERVGQ